LVGVWADQTDIEMDENLAYGSAGAMVILKVVEWVDASVDQTVEMLVDL
jgi:hypothetical protein